MVSNKIHFWTDETENSFRSDDISDNWDALSVIYPIIEYHWLWCSHTRNFTRVTMKNAMSWAAFVKKKDISEEKSGQFETASGTLKNGINSFIPVNPNSKQFLIIWQHLHTFIWSKAESLIPWLKTWFLAEDSPFRYRRRLIGNLR